MQAQPFITAADGSAADGSAADGSAADGCNESEQDLVREGLTYMFRLAESNRYYEHVQLKRRFVILATLDSPHS